MHDDILAMRGLRKIAMLGCGQRPPAIINYSLLIINFSKVIRVLHGFFAVGDVGISVFFGYAGVAAVRVEVRTQILVRRKVAVREGHIVFPGSS